VSAADFVHRYVPAQEEGAPTLLLLHGTGGDENDLLPLGRALWPGAALLSPRGKVLEAGMPRFFRRLAAGVFDEPDLILRSYELARFVGDAAAEYGFSPKNVVAAGFSNGANIAASMLLLHPDVLRGAMLFSPMVPLVPQTMPDLRGTPVFIGAGRNDPMVPALQTERLADLLRDGGSDVTVHWESSGHALTQTEVAAAREWLTKLDAARILDR
jgi:predicted esterase